MEHVSYLKKTLKKYQFQNICSLESSELPQQVSFTNEELNSSSSNPDGATPRKSGRKKRKRKSTTKVMSKVMAVRQQQQKLTFSGFETNSSDKDSSSNTNTSTSASTSGGACASTTTTRWEMSAETLLTMTRTFLRYVPEVNKFLLNIF